MKNIPAVEHVAPNQLAMAYREIQERFDLDEVPGILKCFSSRPDVLWNFVPFADSLVLDPGHLSRHDRELIAVFVSALNGSPHCTDMHGHLLQLEGGDPKVPIDLASGAVSAAPDAKLGALLDLARLITVDASRINPEDVDIVRAAGWSEEEISETVLITAYFNLMNRLATAFGVPPRGLLNLC